ncbi:MAG TPA: DUF4912 domain-containing protein [Candidatus Hypogeohydataceae bacterium YC38]
MEAPEKTATFKEFPPQPFIDHGPQLPQHYGEDKLVAMSRDPYWLFLYWELEGPAGRQAPQEAPWALWVKCLTDQTSYHQDIQVWVRNWYLQVAPGKSYQIEIGYFEPSGHFKNLASSMVVETPRAGPSEDYTEIWAHFFKDFVRGQLVKKRRRPSGRPKGPPEVPVPGLSPGIMPPPASPGPKGKTI